MESQLIKDANVVKEVLIERLQAARNQYEEKLSNREIARRTGISPAHIDGIMRGRNLPSLEKLIRISLILNKDPFEMVDGLEMYIKPVGFNIELWDEETELEYKKHMLAIIRYAEEEFDVSDDDIEPESTQYPHTGEITVEDETMRFDGFLKDGKVHAMWVKEEIVNGNIYCVNYKGEYFVRRLWQIGSQVLLIPSVIHDSKSIVQCEVDDIEEIGIPYRVDNML